MIHDGCFNVCTSSTVKFEALKEQAANHRSKLAAVKKEYDAKLKAKDTAISSHRKENQGLVKNINAPT